MCLAIPAKVISVEGSIALVSVEDVEYNASLLLLDGVKPGDLSCFMPVLPLKKWIRKRRRKQCVFYLKLKRITLDDRGMKYIDEYRNKELILAVAKEIKKISKKEISLMEVCGGHTMAIHRFGLTSLLPPNLHLLFWSGMPCLRVQPALYRYRNRI